MESIYKAELRDKVKLARRGKGSRKRTRYVALPRSEFDNHNYSDVSMGISQDQRTHPPRWYDTHTKQWYNKLSYRKLDPTDPLAQPLERKSKFFRPIKL